MLEVKVLGIGCPKCQRLEAVAREAAKEAGIDIHITKVTDMAAIMAYPILSTPGLVINEELVCSARIPSRQEVVAWLRSAQA